ncbi:hypothetical protein VTK56DRAFT_709 [Thermocarpiscus australiensis]
MGSRDGASGLLDHPHLGHSINIATRKVHAKLNKNILVYLPLALPRHAPNPSVYVSGLLHIAPIYLTFESLWQDVLHNHEQSAEEGGYHAQAWEPLPDSGGSTQLPATEIANQPVAPERVYSVLNYLRLPDLMRSGSLLLDIRSITGWPEDVVNEQIEAAAKAGHLGEFVSHIKRSVDEHPHVLLAYAWVLYMALFSGGRILRAALEAAGPNFWGATCGPVQSSGRACAEPIPIRQLLPAGRLVYSAPQSSTGSTPLEFFRFAGPQDGEDLKLEFKKRLKESEHLLTPQERDDVVREALCIFDNVNSLVAELHSLFSSSSRSAIPADSSPHDAWARWFTAGLSSRIWDGIAAAKDRGLRTLARPQTGQGDGIERGGDASSSAGSDVGSAHAGEQAMEAASGFLDLGSAVAADKTATSLYAGGSPTSTLGVVDENSLPLLGDSDSDAPAYMKGVKGEERSATESVTLRGKFADPEKQPLLPEAETTLRRGEKVAQRLRFECTVWNFLVVLAIAGVSLSARYAWS